MEELLLLGRRPLGDVGRVAGEVRWDVIESARWSEPEANIDDSTLERATINTDEWNGYPTTSLAVYFVFSDQFSEP